MWKLSTFPTPLEIRWHNSFFVRRPCSAPQFPHSFVNSLGCLFVFSFIANLAFIASSQGIYYSSIAVSHHFHLDQRALRCSADLISFVKCQLRLSQQSFWLCCHKRQIPKTFERAQLCLFFSWLVIFVTTIGVHFSLSVHFTQRDLNFCIEAELFLLI